MPTEVEIPDLGIVEFPDAMSERDISVEVPRLIQRNNVRQGLGAVSQSINLSETARAATNVGIQGQIEILGEQRAAKRAKIKEEIEAKSEPSPAWLEKTLGFLGNQGSEVVGNLANPVNLINKTVNAIAGRPVVSEYKGANLEGLIQQPVQMVEELTPGMPRGTLTGPDNPITGVAKGAEEIASGFTTGEMLSSLPAFAAGPELALLKTGGKAIMAGGAIKSVPESIKNLQQVASDPDATQADIAKAVTGVVIGSYIATKMAEQVPTSLPGVAATAGKTLLPTQKQALDIAAKEMERQVRSGELTGGESTRTRQVERPTTFVSVSPDLQILAPQTAAVIEQTTTEIPNAKTIRTDTGQLREPGQAIEGGEAARSDDLQLAPPGTPNAPGQAEVEPEVKAPVAADVENAPLRTEEKAEPLVEEPTPSAPVEQPNAQRKEAAVEPLTPVGGEPTAAVPASPAKAETTEKVEVGPGMGGAIPSEFERNPELATSIKNERVDEERDKRGLPKAMEPAKRSFGEVWDRAMALIDHDPDYQLRLINQLLENPHAVTDIEDALLLHRQIDLQNEYGKATRDLAQAYEDKRMDAVATEKARVAGLSDQLLDLYNINKKVGTATGRGLNARKMMAYEDFTLAKMELEKRAAKGGAPLTDAERSEVVRLNKKIEETQKAYDDYVAATTAKEAQRAVQDALDEVERQARKEQPPYHPRVLKIAEQFSTYMEKQADSALARIKERRGRLTAGIDPTELADLSIIGAAKLTRGVVELAKWSEAMIRDVGDWIKPHLDEIRKASEAKLETESAQLEKKHGKTTAERVKRAPKDAAAKEADATIKIKERIDSGKREEITPLVQKLARAFVETGIREREALIDAVHGVLESLDPSFTRRETMDAISGYGDFKQLTKDEISVKLRDLKGQMQQVAKLEDMQAGKPPMKTGLERRIPSPEESRLIKLVNQAKNEFQIPIDDPNTQLKSSLDTLKTRLKNRKTELEGMLERKEFAKKPKRIIQMDAEANRLHYEMSKAKVAWHEALMKDRLANRSLPRKVFDTAGEVLNLSRAVVTSSDFSGVLRQGGFIAFAHPIRAAKSFPAMFRAFRSEAGQHAVDQEILSRKNYPLYQQGKLYLSEHGHKLSQMEEAYMSRWADKIPLVAGSQRAYVTFLNKLRADSFDAMANSLARNKELTPTEVNAIANFVNVATGRGNLGMKENALVGLNSVFFAPRYVASRFQLLAGQPLYRGSARTRLLMAKEYGRFLAGAAVVYGLAQMDGATIEQDPRSSDFGKLRYGNTRIDPMAGLLQNTVLLSRLVSGETKTQKDKLVPIRENLRPLKYIDEKLGTHMAAHGNKVPYGVSDAAGVSGRFVRTKLSPALGTGLNILSGKDVVGQPVTPVATASNMLAPLSLQDIYSTMREQGVERGTIFALLSIFGMGLQNYEERRTTTR